MNQTADTSPASFTTKRQIMVVKLFKNIKCEIFVQKPQNWNYNLGNPFTQQLYM